MSTRSRCYSYSYQNYATSIIQYSKKLGRDVRYPVTECYLCQTCSLEVADLQRYVRHVKLHEDQLFKEAMEKRANSAALPSTSVQLDGVAVRLPVQSLVTGEADNINIKIEAVDDEDYMESIGTENSHAGHSLPDDKQKAFVFEAGVVQNIDGNNSESFNDHSGRQNLTVKLPIRTMCVTMGNTAIKAQAVDSEHVSRINLIKEETTSNSSDSLVFESTDNARDISSHNSQVFTINVNNMESADNFFKGTDNCNLVRYNLQKTAETRFDEVIEEDLLEGSPHGSSVLDVVQKGAHLEPKIIGDRRQEDIVLNVIESTERTPILGVEEENQTLITLSQVMSDDGHQYIIGISPEEIAESQENIFSIGQNGH